MQDFEQINEIIKELGGLQGDERSAAVDALGRIIAGMSGGGSGKLPPGMPIPPELPVDPDLEEPESDNDGQASGSDDFDIDDPDHLLKNKNGDRNSSEDMRQDNAPQDSDVDPEAGDDVFKDPNKDQSKDKSSTKSNNSDKAADADDNMNGSDENTIDGDDLIDDIKTDEHGNTPETMVSNASEQADNANKAKRRKIDAARAKAAAEKALKRLEKLDPSELTQSGEKAADVKKELEQAVADLKKTLDDLNTDWSNSLEELSDAEFDKQIIAAQKATDKVIKQVYDTDSEARVKRLQTVLDDSDILAKLNKEDAQVLATDPTLKKLKADEEDKKRYDELERRAINTPLKTFEAFKSDLLRAIAGQIGEAQQREMAKKRSYSRLNRLHEPDNVVMQGTYWGLAPLEHPPTVAVYFDQSSSWTPADVKRGMEAINQLLQFEKQGLLHLEVYYFAMDLFTNAASARAQRVGAC